MKHFLLLLTLCASVIVHGADKKISDLTLLPAASFATGDLIPIVDVSAGETKRTRILDFDVRFQALDPTLTALAGYNTNGLIAQTAADTFAGRTLTAGSSKLAVTNGDGVSGNPTVDVTEANLTVSNMAGTLGQTHGGTGFSTYTTGDLLYASAANTLSKLGAGTSGYVLTAAGAGVAPAWTAAAVAPTGTVIMFGGSACPTDYLPLDGSAVSRSTYSALFAVTSTTYGVGDNSTTFNVPDARGAFVRGSGSQTISAIVYTGTRGTTQGDQAQGHVHTLTINGAAIYQGATGGSGANNQNNTNGNNTGGQTWTMQATPVSDGSNGTPRIGSENRPANIVLLYCIKT